MNLTNLHHLTFYFSHFLYPPSTSSETRDEIIAKEMQTAALEREQILEYESHLAAGSSKAVITEKTSLLLSQVGVLKFCSYSKTIQFDDDY